MTAKDRELPDLTPRQRMLSASWGGLLTSLLVTPFDVIRIQQQSKIAFRQPAGPFCRNTNSHLILQQGVLDVWCPKCEFAGCVPDAKVVNGGFFATAVPFF